jgi:hypothetical protein
LNEVESENENEKMQQEGPIISPEEPIARARAA